MKIEQLQVLASSADPDEHKSLLIRESKDDQNASQTSSEQLQIAQGVNGTASLLSASPENDENKNKTNQMAPVFEQI